MEKTWRRFAEGQYVFKTSNIVLHFIEDLHPRGETHWKGPGWVGGAA
jgi:hypothetical protein